MVDPIALLLVKGLEGVEEVDGGAEDLEVCERSGGSGEGIVRRGGTVLHYD